MISSDILKIMRDIYADADEISIEEKETHYVSVAVYRNYVSEGIQLIRPGMPTHVFDKVTGKMEVMNYFKYSERYEKSGNA